jgi:hypothetical protein
MSVPTHDSTTQEAFPIPRAEPSTSWRFALFVFLMSGMLWLGGSYVRAMIGNDLLKFGTMEFEEYISPDAEQEIYRLLSFASLSGIVCYTLTVISGTVFLVTSPFKFREHGWLMMSAILFFLFVPVEAYTMYLDGKMIYSEFFTTADNQVFRELFLARLGALAGTPIIGNLCYLTIIGLAVFQPLRKTQRHSI